MYPSTFQFTSHINNCVLSNDVGPITVLVITPHTHIHTHTHTHTHIIILIELEVDVFAVLDTFSL